MMMVLHLWILRDCHQKMNGQVHAYLMQVCVISSSQHTLSLEGLSRRGARATTTNNKVHVPGRNMYVLSQYECDWCAWNNSTS